MCIRDSPCIYDGQTPGPHPGGISRRSRQYPAGHRRGVGAVSYTHLTKFIIAQRVSSIEDADKILVMDGGKISAMGTHEQLLESCGIYREIYESQTKGGEDHE